MNWNVSAAFFVRLGMGDKMASYSNESGGH